MAQLTLHSVKYVVGGGCLFMNADISDHSAFFGENTPPLRTKRKARTSQKRAEPFEYSYRWTSPTLPAVSPLAVATYPPQRDATGTLFVLVHGEGFNRHYWDLHVPGYTRDAYSCALYLSSQGHAVVTFDCLGTGENAVAMNGYQLTPSIVAQSISDVVNWSTHAVEWKMTTREQPVRIAQTVLVGHSVGGYLALLASMHNTSIDAFIFQGTALGAYRGTLFTQGPLPDAHGYFTLPRTFMRPSLYGPFLPPVEVLEADEHRMMPTPISLMTIFRHIADLRENAASIKHPVLLTFGEQDVAADPLDELSYFAHAPSRNLFILHSSGHLTNYADTRRQLWRRMHAFALFIGE